MKTFQVNQPVGEIVAIVPKAGEIFKQYHIDFCCGGDRPLAQVIKEQNLNSDEVLGKLNEAYREAEEAKNHKDFTSMSMTELADYIENTHHVFTKHILPELSEYTYKILRAHGARHNELFKVHKLFHDLKTDLDQHLLKEEELLFPLVRDYESSPSQEKLKRIMQTMSETEDEHVSAGNILKELRRLTEDYKIPSDACQTLVKTYERMQELESDLFQHIHLENNILFKNIRIKADGRQTVQ